MKYLKNSIEQCQLFKQFELTIIDWGKMDKNAQKSLKIDICKYWNEHENLTPKDLAKVFGIDRHTVNRYLNWGNSNGLCCYDGKEEQRKNDERRSVFVYFLKPNGEKWFNEPLSLNQLSKKTAITTQTLYRSLENKKTLNGRNAKYDNKYIDSVVVLAEKNE